MEEAKRGTPREWDSFKLSLELFILLFNFVFLKPTFTFPPKLLMFLDNVCGSTRNPPEHFLFGSLKALSAVLPKEFEPNLF